MSFRGCGLIRPSAMNGPHRCVAAASPASCRVLSITHLAAFGLIMGLTGCAAIQPPDFEQGVPPLVAAAMADGARDMRGMYRAALCRRLAIAPAKSQAAVASCSKVLPEVGNEPLPPAVRVPSGAQPFTRYRVLLVAGLFAECFGEPTRPMVDVEEALRADGFDPVRLSVPGRGSMTVNADALALRIRAIENDGRRFIVLAYSKGLVDVLDMAARYPELAPRLAAVISLSGAARGTPLADEHVDSYRRWVAGLPMPGCDAGTGEELLDLSRSKRSLWWKQHGSALPVPVYTLVAAPAPGRMSPVLQPIHRMLARTDPRNDGQLLWFDQIAPGSRLLGFINADHWAIANPLSKSLPLLAFLFVDDVPRSDIVAAAIDVVDATLSLETTE